MCACIAIAIALLSLASISLCCTLISTRALCSPPVHLCSDTLTHFIYVNFGVACCVCLPAFLHSAKADGSSDESEAMKVYQKAAAGGSAESQYKLGWSLQYGIGATKNEKEAIK